MTPVISVLNQSVVHQVLGPQKCEDPDFFILKIIVPSILVTKKQKGHV